jgi:hypothetical protein
MCSIHMLLMIGRHRFKVHMLLTIAGKLIDFNINMLLTNDCLKSDMCSRSCVQKEIWHVFNVNMSLEKWQGFAGMMTCGHSTCYDCRKGFPIYFRMVGESPWRHSIEDHKDIHICNTRARNSSQCSDMRPGLCTATSGKTGILYNMPCNYWIGRSQDLSMEME